MTTTTHMVNQQQLHTRQLKTSNNTHETTTTIYRSTNNNYTQDKTSNNTHETNYISLVLYKRAYRHFELQ